MIGILLGIIASIGAILGVLGFIFLSEKIEYNNLLKTHTKEDADAIWKRINMI